MADDRMARIQALKAQRAAEQEGAGTGEATPTSAAQAQAPVRRRPAEASRWLVAGASVATGFGLVAGFAAANSGEAAAPVAAPAPAAAPQVIVVRVPDDPVAVSPAGGATVIPAQAVAEPQVIRIEREVPARAQPAAQASQPVTASEGS